MSDNKLIGCLFGGIALFMLMMGGICVIDTSIKTTAQVVIAQEIGSAISSFADALKTGGKN